MNKDNILIPGQWLTIRYKRNKAYIPNPNTKAGSKCGFGKSHNGLIMAMDSIGSLVSSILHEVHCWN